VRIMGLDVGDRRIGVALSDELGLLATPFAVLKRSSLREDVQRVVRLVAEQGVGTVVVGLPYSLSGELGPQAVKVKRFGEALANALPVPVIFWDERYSTVEASRMLTAAGRRARRQKPYIDAAAAAVMLQSYLDARRC